MDTKSNNRNCSVINIDESGAFKVLCDKIGVDEATDFLCKLAAKPQFMLLFEKLYLEGAPKDYPIATNNKQDYMYRGPDGTVQSIDEAILLKIMDRLQKNVFLEAADPLLTRFIRYNQGERVGSDGDYNQFRKLQNGAHAAKIEKGFMKELCQRTYNPDHPFFRGT